MKKTIKWVLACLFFLYLISMPSISTKASVNEVELNDTYDSANVISVNTGINGNLSKNSDVDWFKFNVLESGYFSVIFNHDVVNSTLSKWTISLFDSTGVNYIGTNKNSYSFSGDKNGQTPNFGVSPGTYFIKISKGGTDGSYYSNANYEMTVNFKASNNWEKESNNSFEYSNLIQIGTNYSGALTVVSDADWYKVNITDSTKIMITFNHDIISKTSDVWSVVVYDSTGNKKLYKYNIKGSDQSASSDYFDVSTGINYICISKGSIDASGYSNIDYSFTISKYHEHIGEWTIIKKPTCTETGLEERTCTICGNKETKIINASGHNYQKEVIDEATIFNKGLIRYTCLECGDFYEEADDHLTWVLPTIIIGGIALIALIIFIVVKVKEAGYSSSSYSTSSHSVSSSSSNKEEKEETKTTNSAPKEVLRRYAVSYYDEDAVRSFYTTGGMTKYRVEYDIPKDELLTREQAVRLADSMGGAVCTIVDSDGEYYK